MATHKPSNTSLRHQFFLTEIKRGYHEDHGNYSSPRIATQLYQEGIETNKRLVATLMRKDGIVSKGCHQRRTIYKRQKSMEEYSKDNLINREFTQEIIDRIWVTDIAYIHCSNGRWYVSTYIDLATRIPR